LAMSQNRSEVVSPFSGDPGSKRTEGGGEGFGLLRGKPFWNGKKTLGYSEKEKPRKERSKRGVGRHRRKSGTHRSCVSHQRKGSEKMMGTGEIPEHQTGEKVY